MASYSPGSLLNLSDWTLLGGLETDKPDRNGGLPLSCDSCAGDAGRSNDSGKGVGARARANFDMSKGRGEADGCSGADDGRCGGGV